MNLTRLWGLILMVAGLIVTGIAAAWLLTNQDLEPAARILGLGIVLLVLAGPLMAGGVYVAFAGGQQARQAADAAQQRALLNIVQSRGQVSVQDLALELQLPRDQIRDMIDHLVGLGLFTGYINWDKGLIYSEVASKLQDRTQCPNCGGAISLKGQDLAVCQFCGTEFFL